MTRPESRMEIRRAADRFVTEAEGRTTHHSFSFGAHYDPTNTGFGLLVCHNDDHVQPGGGYPDHPHQDMEIVTWVLSGALDHRDSAGRAGTIEPGRVQVLSAGDGVVHSETVDPASGPTRFVQTWVLPDEPGGEPQYDAANVSPGQEWLPVVSGSRPDAATRIRSRGATLQVARLEAGQRLEVPEVAQSHLFVATGSVDLYGTALGEADAVRLTGQGGELTATVGADVLLWTFEGGRG